MKKSLLIFVHFTILLILFSSDILSQNFVECGIIEHYEENIDSTENIYSDRFGNIYSESYLVNLTDNTEQCLQSGYFELNFSDDVSDEMQAVICEVFYDLSQTIPQRTVTSSCNEPIEPIPVRIDVIADIEDEDIGGQGTPFYADPGDIDCLEVLLGRVYMKTNGGSPLPEDSFGNQVPDGLLNLNPDIIWNYDTNLDPVPAGVTDLYAVVLHEALHILGYASRVNIIENPNEPEAYSLWDQQLFYAENYIPGGGSIIQSLSYSKYPNGQLLESHH